MTGLALGALVGLNLTVTCVAFRQPRACRFNRSSGIFASLPALLAGGACCAPTIVLILGIQVSSVLLTTFQLLIPMSATRLLITLGAMVHRTEPRRLVRR